MNLSNMSIEQKRELLTSILSKGKFAHVKWVKKDGSVAERVIKLFMEKLFTSGDRNDVQANPAAHVNKIFTAVDAQKETWCNIDVTNLLEVKSSSTIYN